MNFFGPLIQGYNNNPNMAMQNNFQAYNDQSDKVKEVIRQCTYPQETKFMVEKAVKQVFHVYPNFNIDTLTFTEQNIQKRYVEINGKLEIDVRGSSTAVHFFMMIPAFFPKKAPNVRFINHSPTSYSVVDFYKNFRSETDPKSFILNSIINQIKYWEPSKSLVNVILEVNDFLRNKFPFQRINNGNSGWTNQWQSPPQNNGNQGFNNFQNQPNNNFHQPINSNQLAGMGANKQPPIPFKANNNITDIIAKSQNYVGKSKKTLEKIQDQHAISIISIQQLDMYKKSLESEEEYLRRQNFEMAGFMNKSAIHDDIKLANLISPADDRSSQILDLIASIKSRQECANLLESQFNESNISLDDFMKNLRKIEESKFEERFLLRKCQG